MYPPTWVVACFSFSVLSQTEWQSHKGARFYENRPFMLYGIMNNLAGNTNAVTSGIRANVTNTEKTWRKKDDLTAEDKAPDDSDSEEGGANPSVIQSKGTLSDFLILCVLV